jgi:hypothetical protein
MLPYALLNLLLTLVLILVSIMHGIDAQSATGFVLFSVSVAWLLLALAASWLWEHNLDGRWLRDASKAFGDAQAPYVSPLLKRVVQLALLLAMAWTLAIGVAVPLWFASAPLAALFAMGVVLAGGGVCMLGFDWLRQQSFVDEAAQLGRAMKYPPSVP